MEQPAGSRLTWLIVALSLVATAAAAGLYYALRPAEGRIDYDLVFYFPLAAGAGMLLVMLTTNRLPAYRISQILRILFYLLTVPYTVGADYLEGLLVVPVVLELCFFEAHPLNLILSLSVTTAAGILRWFIFLNTGPSLLRIAARQLPLLITGYSVAVLASRLNRFREKVIEMQGENTRMENSVVQLTRANSVYQDYAMTAREAAADQERKRITRDIHDVVGYTLTNNIMLMEAALDMMQENPLGLPATIETARENAEEGLARIRQSLYDLRRQETVYPVGLRAVHRLATVFEKATAIRVKCEFGNVPWTITEEVDSAIYHMVQEGLINSFRHGRADQVSVIFWADPDRIMVRVRDNGRGAERVTEGIGLKGMRERISKANGELAAHAVAGGFLLEATIPTNGRFSAEKDQAAHR
jgi:signal transduction histidine kinase